VTIRAVKPAPAAPVRTAEDEILMGDTGTYGRF
jgi:hypothetical protein